MLRVDAFNSGDPAGIVRSVRSVFVNVECYVRVYFFARCMKDYVLYLVLLVFSDILFAWNHCAILESSELARAIRELRSESESRPVVSSAYRTVRSSVQLGRSFIKQENRVGPRMVP